MPNKDDKNDKDNNMLHQYSSKYSPTNNPLFVTFSNEIFRLKEEIIATQWSQDWSPEMLFELAKEMEKATKDLKDFAIKHVEKAMDDESKETN